MTESILTGIKVLDLSIWLPGPYCSMILGDLGAEVIKVERRLLGDPTRHAHPFVNHQSCHFLLLNRNKRSIALSLKRDEGRDILRRLASTADVVLEGFRPGFVDEIGIGYEDVRELNPRVVYCSLSGYGQDGPYAQRAGHDINYAALSGLLDLMPSAELPALRFHHSSAATLTGLSAGLKMLPAIQIADLSAALFATIGILAALIRRTAQGRGMFLDVSMLDSVASLLGPTASSLLCGQAVSESYKYLIGYLPAYNLYQTSDGRYMALGAIEPTFWADFCKAIGCEHLIAKHIPDDNERDTVIAELQQVFGRRTQQEWIQFFADKNVCCEPVHSLEEALTHPQLQHRGMIFYLEHPTASRVGQIGLPIRFGDITSDHTMPAPLLGQHTQQIMRELGYDEETILQLRQRRVIATPEDMPAPATFTRRAPTGPTDNPTDCR